MPAPHCYYHPSSQVQNFCLHPACVLPLCQQCLAIHRKQNPSGEHASLLISFEQAKTIAIQTIDKEHQSVLKAQRKFAAQFMEFRRQTLAAMERVLWGIEEKLAVHSYSFQNLKKQLEERKSAIGDNSLKQIIHHYESGSMFVNRAEDFRFTVSEEDLRKYLQGCYSDRFEISDLGASAPDVRFNQSCHSEEGSIRQAQSLRDESNLKQKTKNKFSHTTSDFNKSKSKKRRGIFIASSPDSYRHYESCKKAKTEMKSNDQLDNSIENSRVLFAKKQIFNGKDDNRRLIARPQSEKKLVIKRSDNRVDNKFQKITLDNIGCEKGSENEQIKKWKKVVNTKGLNRCPQSQTTFKNIHSNLENFSDQILNPKEMRELIMKKRNRAGEGVNLQLVRGDFSTKLL